MKIDHAAFALLIPFLASSCDSGSPNARPTGPSTEMPDISGIWLGPQRIVSVTGGECVGEALQSVVGESSIITLTITQAGRDISARYLGLQTGITTFSGTISGNSLSLTGAFSTTGTLSRFHCANGLLRDLQWQTATITATVSGNGLSGEDVFTFTTSTVAGVETGVLVRGGTFDLRR